MTSRAPEFDRKAGDTPNLSVLELLSKCPSLNSYPQPTNDRAQLCRVASVVIPLSDLNGFASKFLNERRRVESIPRVYDKQGSECPRCGLDTGDCVMGDENVSLPSPLASIVIFSFSWPSSSSS